MVSRALACPESPAAATALKVFQEGGTALEAGVAAAFAQAVTNPIGCGIGGAAFILMMKNGWPEPIYLNAQAAIGSLATPEVFEDDFVGRSGERLGRYLLASDQNMLGYRAILTPGFVRGMQSVLDLAGSSSTWPRLLGSVVSLALDGFEVYPYLERYYTFEGPDRLGFPSIFRKFGRSSVAREIYFMDGKPPSVGQVLRQPLYGRALERLSREGPDEFYEGLVAKAMADDFHANGAFTTASDLSGYRVIQQAPVRGTYRDLEVFTSPPPGYGIVLLLMLALSESLDLKGMEWNGPEYLETISWVTRTAFSYCIPFMGDPRFMTVPVSWLTSKSLVTLLMERRIKEVSAAWMIEANGHTTHMTSGDSEGNVLSITHSIGSVGGAGVLTPSLGFLHNNFMGQFNPLRGYHDSVAPHKRMGGGCPTILFRSGRPWLAIGSSGGTRLISAMFQTIANMVIFKMPLRDALVAPRIHSEIDRVIYIEPGFDPVVRQELQRRGYEIEVTEYMGCNQAVQFEEGRVIAGSDPRGSGIGAEL